MVSPPTATIDSVEDDEKTWKILVNLKPSDSDLTERLEGLKQRLQEDFSQEAANVYWSDLTKRLVSLGFNYSNDPMNQDAPSNSNASTSDPSALFASDLGKQHIQATCALLKLNDSRAIQVTQGALQKIYKDESKLKSLLGTKDFLMKTALYHFQQRSARLALLTECLRLEQDPDSVQQPALAKFLDSLDSNFYNGSKDRGLFRLLVTIACMQDSIPSRDQLETSKSLQSQRESRSLQDSSLLFTQTKIENAFEAAFLEETRSQTLRERNEAMEALLVLLYHRVNGGVHRADLALILVAFQTSHAFFSTLPKAERLSELAGLICAESMGLWRAFEVESGPSNDWATKHPLLVGIVSSGGIDTSRIEIESLRSILIDCVKTGVTRKTQTNRSEAPEALALLSFGLLLCLAHDSVLASTNHTTGTAYWESFKQVGTELASAANNEGGAFDYLYYLVNHLSREKKGSKSIALHDQFYDWQLSNRKANALLIANGQEETAADVILYTSIAREVLSASISTFETTILAIDNENSFDNIGVLCNLAASIYQNNAILSEEFWNSWASYISTPGPPIVPLPICALMEASHKLAVKALEALNDNRISDEMFLPAVAPFFRLLSSMCHTSDMVETIFAILPEGMVRRALLACRLPLGVTGSDSYCKSRIIFLGSLGNLAQVADSTSCLESLRLSLEELAKKHIVDGPRVLGRILAYAKDATVAKSVLQIMAHLLDGAPQPWALELARQFIPTREQESILTMYLVPGIGAEHEAALVLAELVEHLTAVVFCKKFTEDDAIVFLHVVTDGILSAGTTLASSLSVASASLTGKLPVGYETVQIILQLFTNFLKLIRTVIELHHSPQVTMTGVEVRDSLITALASSAGLGQAISYYAVAPVSLSLSIIVQNALADEDLVQSLPEIESTQKQYGAWQSILKRDSGVSGLKNFGKKILLDSITTLTVNDFDLQGMQERGWTGGNQEDMPLNAAWSAIRLLSMWALHVEDIVKSHVESTKIEIEHPVVALVERLSPQRLLSSLAVSPIPCRSNSVLAAIWESTGLSNFEMLLPFLASDNLDTSSVVVPSSITLDLLNTCLVHAKFISPSERAADTILFSGVYRSSRFSKLLIDLINCAMDLSSKTSLGSDEKRNVINGLLSLRLLCACVEGSPAVADKVLQLESNSVVPTLIKAATKVKDLLSIGQNSDIFGKENQIVQMRLATGAISVLSSLWTSARTTTPGQTGSAGSRLVDVVDAQTEFVADLITVVTDYANANDIESNIVLSRESEYARCTLTTYMSKALDIMATEVAYLVCNGERRTNGTLRNLLLKTFFQPQRFTSFKGYKYAAESTIQFAASGIDSMGNLNLPIGLLRCFSSTSSGYFSNDFYLSENAFDVALSAHWLAEICDGNGEEMEGSLSRAAIAYQLVSCDLKMISSWKDFAEVLMYFSLDYSSRSGNTITSAKRLFDLAQDTLQALNFNIEEINRAQVEVAEDFMSKESSHMAKLLTNLFLFFLEMGSADEESTQFLAHDDLIDLLELLTKTSEMLFNVVSTVSATATLEICIMLERPLLASSIIINNLIETTTTSNSGPSKHRENMIYNSMCRVNSKVLQAIGDITDIGNSDSNMKEVQDHRDSLRCCISLFTVLVVKGQGSQRSDASYFKLISETLRDYHVLEKVIKHGMAASNAAANSILSSFTNRETEYGKRGPSEYEKANLILVQSILDLLHAVAEANDSMMLTILPEAQFGQFVARNPLFDNAAGVWAQQDIGHMPPRGYNLSKEKTDIGVDDPIHTIWLTSMKVLQASLRSSTTCSAIQGIKSTGKVFVGMAAEFLVIYQNSITSCLKYCGSKLTRNALREATQILALVAELSKRDTRDVFLQGYGEVCEELIKWSKCVVVNISKFLGASGTARELFHALEQYESTPDLLENPNNIALSPTTVQHPLLSGRGLQSAKHEAYKLSHFAARCCEKVTKADYEAAFTVPSNLKEISRNKEQYSELERLCRLSVTGNFALQMEKTAADCLSQAISFIWKTHPLSHSFKMFSEREILQINAMELVKPEMIIGYRPAGGDSILGDSSAETFETLRFGRVISANTVNRTWNVKVLRQDGGHLAGENISFDNEKSLSNEQPAEIVRLRQLAGVEEVSMRKTVVTYAPAPDTKDTIDTSSASLTLGNLLLVLRWCHQRSKLEGGSNQMKLSIQRIAEQVTALLGAELSIHEENKSALNVSKPDKKQLDAQVFEMFVDPDILMSLDRKFESSAALPSAPKQQGRLKSIIDSAAWQSIQPQVFSCIERTWRDVNEKEKRRREKRAYSDTNWFSGRSLQSKGYKSAFRG